MLIPVTKSLPLEFVAENGAAEITPLGIRFPNKVEIGGVRYKLVGTDAQYVVVPSLDYANLMGLRYEVDDSEASPFSGIETVPVEIEEDDGDVLEILGEQTKKNLRELVENELTEDGIDASSFPFINRWVYSTFISDEDWFNFLTSFILADSKEAYKKKLGDFVVAKYIAEEIGDFSDKYLPGFGNVRLSILKAELKVGNEYQTVAGESLLGLIDEKTIKPGILFGLRFIDRIQQKDPNASIKSLLVRVDEEEYLLEVNSDLSTIKYVSSDAGTLFFVDSSVLYPSRTTSIRNFSVGAFHKLRLLEKGKTFIAFSFSNEKPSIPVVELPKITKEEAKNGALRIAAKKNKSCSDVVYLAEYTSVLSNAPVVRTYPICEFFDSVYAEFACNFANKYKLVVSPPNYLDSSRIYNALLLFGFNKVHIYNEFHESISILKNVLNSENEREGKTYKTKLFKYDGYIFGYIVHKANTGDDLFVTIGVKADEETESVWSLPQSVLSNLLRMFSDFSDKKVRIFVTRPVLVGQLRPLKEEDAIVIMKKLDSFGTEYLKKLDIRFYGDKVLVKYGDRIGVVYSDDSLSEVSNEIKRVKQTNT